MQEAIKSAESLPLEVLDVMRSLVAAIRAVKLYPPNNPVYSQSVKKAHEALDRFLGTAPAYHVGVQKTYFTYEETQVGKDSQVNKPIAQDLFAKGMRDITFTEGLTEQELLTLLRALALSSEELGMKSGISSLLWEADVTHIKVIEAGLGEVISVKASVTESKPKAPTEETGPDGTKKDARPSGRTLLLSDLLIDPKGFGAAMVELAEKTRAEDESVGDRLYTLYQDMGRTIREKHPEQSEAMFEGLAQSALSLDPELRDGLVGNKLYGDFDSDMANEQKAELEEHVPNELHEILSGRFSNVWNVKQVATLLKKSSEKKPLPPAPKVSPADLKAEPLPAELGSIAREMAEYNPAELEALRTISGLGQDADIVEAAVRTYIFLLPQVKNPHRPAPEETDIAVFSGLVRQLEDMLTYLLKQKDYDLASLIVRALHMPVDPAFKPRLDEALGKATSAATITATLTDLRTFSKGSPEYRSAYAYLRIFEREATEVLLELIAEESDRSIRVSLLEFVKDLGKNQFELLGVHLTDHRWYVVRNIVSIMGESKDEQALPYLQREVGHKDVRIRQEVVKALMSIGGKKAAGLLAKFLDDPNEDMQLMASRAFATCGPIGREEARYLTEYLERLAVKKKAHLLITEAIRSLGKIGGNEAGEFLKRYDRIKWWKPRKLQREVRDAAQRAMDEIKRRQVDGGQVG
jgi:HEAT repeats